VFYLPIYFQAIKGVSPVSSGVHLIPLILGLTLAQIVIGTIITITGIFKPFFILGPAIAAVGAGLLMLLNQDTTTGKWIGFQILLGVGAGCCLSIPLMLSQSENVVKTKDVSTATPVIIFAQSIGSAFVLPSAQTLFQTQLTKSLRHYVPNIEPSTVLAAGATHAGISSFPEASIPGIEQSYVDAVKYALALGIPLAGLSLCVSVFMPSFRYHNAEKNVNKPNTEIGEPASGNSGPLSAEANEEKGEDEVV